MKQMVWMVETQPGKGYETKMHQIGDLIKAYDGLTHEYCLKDVLRELIDNGLFIDEVVSGGKGLYIVVTHKEEEQI